MSYTIFSKYEEGHILIFVEKIEPKTLGCQILKCCRAIVVLQYYVLRARLFARLAPRADPVWPLAGHAE